MNENDRPKFAQLMAGVSELHGKKLTAPLLEIYWRSLSRYELSAIEQAMSNHTLNPDGGQFMPKPADIVRYVEGGGSGRAGLAWSQVDRAIRIVGSCESVVFDDQITMCVLNDMGGWISICETLQAKNLSKTNYPFIAGDFERRYRAYLNAPASISYPRMLMGHIDAENQRLGVPVGRPRCIGNVQNARLIYQKGSAEPKQISSNPVQSLLESMKESA